MCFDSIENTSGYYFFSFDSKDNVQGYYCVSFDSIDNGIATTVLVLIVKIMSLATTV